MDYFEELNRRKINISRDENKYYKDYSAVPDDAIIKYGPDFDELCDKETFLEYQKKIVELKQIFRMNQLSPIEKLMIAYDIARIKPYSLSSDESLNGLPHEILSGKNISCRGYCTLLIELLDSEGVKIKNQGLDVFDKDGNLVDGHARCSVILDDDKYDIHGLFVVSPTEDRYNEENKKYLGTDLQPTDLYSWFLRPLRDPGLYHDDFYEYRINYMATDEEIFTNMNTAVCTSNPELKLNDLIENYEFDDLSSLLEMGFNYLFDGMTKEEILNYANTRYVDFNLLLKIIENVRRVEGYSEQQIFSDIERIGRINAAYFPKETQSIKL